PMIYANNLYFKVIFGNGILLRGIVIEGITVALPIITVGSPTVITPPCAVKSPWQTTGTPLKKTFGAPCTITSGGPTHVHMSPINAAGLLLTKIFGDPGPVIGPPTCGVLPEHIGQTCILPIVATGPGIE